MSTIRTFFALLTAVTLAHLSGSAPATAQSRDIGGCTADTMPAAAPDRAPATRRAGHAWTPAHVRCQRGRWVPVAGAWRRQGTLVEASAFLVRRGNGFAARPGYQLVRLGGGRFVIAEASARRIPVSNPWFPRCRCKSAEGTCAFVASSPDFGCRAENGCRFCQTSYLTGLPAGGPAAVETAPRQPNRPCDDGRPDA